MAFQSFTVEQIKVEGAVRTDLGTVFNYLPVHVGDEFDQQRASAALQALYKTGFFSNVRLDVDGKSLIVVVEERPVIAKLKLDGFSDIGEDDVRKSLTSAGLSEAKVFDSALLDAAVGELRHQYFNKGKYSVIITTDVKPLDQNRVEVTIHVSEGVAARLKEINILGAHVVAADDLQRHLNLSTASWWNPFSRGDQYSRTTLIGDQETLRSYYLNRGYIDFDLHATQVGISPDKKDVFITYGLVEGKQYSVGDIQFVGDVLIPENEMRKLTGIKSGEIFSRDAVTSGVAKIVERLGDLGYAFANVNAVPDVDQKTQVVRFTYYIDVGKRIYVRRINISGNSTTRDEVIRRELRQMESAMYSGSAIKRSKQRLDLLGFFKEVSIDTQPVPGSTDQVDLNVKVTEKETGNLMLSVGVAQGQGLVVSGSIAENNFAGTGNRLELKANGSKVNRTYSLSFSNPYSTPDGVSRGYDLYFRTTDPGAASLGRYRTEAWGMRENFGVPISESNRINLYLGAERMRMTLFSNSPDSYFNFIHQFGDVNNTLLGGASWVSDRRDSAITPTSGVLRSVSTDMGLPGGDIRYIKLNFQNQWFYPLSKHFTLMNNDALGWGKAIGESQLPFYLNYYGGGVTSVRGYLTGSLGPHDGGGNAMGGDRSFVNNLELLFPLPNMEDDNSVRLSVFFDGGMILASNQTLSLEEMRYSSGIALSWVSPLGPLKFSLGVPVKRKPGDQAQYFQFMLGNIF